MAVTDWSTTASSNSTIGGIAISENNMAVGNINDVVREIMAQIAQGITDGDFASVSGFQSEDATLTALAGLATGADKLAYSTGTDTFAQTDFTSYGRTLVGLASAGALAAQINAVTVTSSTLSTTGHIAFDTDGDSTANIKLNWGTGTLGSAVSFNSNFASSCWIVLYTPSGKIGESDTDDEHHWVSSKSVSGFSTSVDGDYSSLPGIYYLAIGV